MKTHLKSALTKFIDAQLLESPYAWWQWDLVKNKVTTNDRKITMLGYSPDDFQDAGYQAFTELLHPEDYPKAMQAMRRYLHKEVPLYQIDYRILRKDRTYTWYLDRGIALEWDEHEQPTILRGLVIDLGVQFDIATHHDLKSIILEALPSADLPDKKLSACSVCQRIALPTQQWTIINELALDAFPLSVSHSICPHCMEMLYAEELYSQDLA